MKFIALALAGTALTAATPLIAQVSASEPLYQSSGTAWHKKAKAAAPDAAAATSAPAATEAAPPADQTAQAAPAAQSDAAPAASSQTAAAVPAGKPNVTAGAQVADANGGAVGTIESVTASTAVVSTGTAKATLPLTAFAQGPNGLVIGLSKTALEAAVAKASGGAQTASAGATATPASIAVGAEVSDPQGGKVGTVAAVSGDLVTVATATSKAQLPKSAFAQGANGLVIAMTATQLDAAAKAAAAPRKTGA